MHHHEDDGEDGDSGRESARVGADEARLELGNASCKVAYAGAEAPERAEEERPLDVAEEPVRGAGCRRIEHDVVGLVPPELPLERARGERVAATQALRPVGR